MKQEDKELLLKDLCARLSYGVKCNVGDDKFYTLSRIEIDDKNGHLLDFIEMKYGLDMQVYLSEVKPYLFPLSSMTEEQKEEFDQLIELELKAISDEIEPIQATAFEVDFYNKHHFDWRGMIPLGLANDATGLNIY